MALQAAHSKFSSSRTTAATSVDTSSMMERRSYSSEFVIKKRDNYYDSDEIKNQQNQLDRASQHIALDVEKKEQEYLKIRLEHSSALQTLAAEIQQLVIPSPRINREQSAPVSVNSAPLSAGYSSHSPLKSVQANAAVEKKLSIPAGYEGAVTSEWIQKMVLDSVVQKQQQQILQLQQQVHELNEHAIKYQHHSSGMESHHLVERYGSSLASLQSQLASMETKQIAYENLTNKKLFDLASRIEVLEESHRSGVYESKKKSSGSRVTISESTSATMIEELTRRLELLESSPSFSLVAADSKRSFYGHLNSSSQGDSPGAPAAVAGAAARSGYSAQFAEAESYDSADSVGSGRSGQRRRSGRERNRSRKIKVEAPRLDFENLAIQLTSTERRHYPWLSNDDSV